MVNVLTQDEVDSLLGGIDEGKVEIETEVSERNKETTAYDFGNIKYGDPQHRMPALRLVNERFAQLLRTSLSAATRKIIDVNVTSLNIIKMEPLKGYLLLSMESSLAFAFVDTFFGGKVAGPQKVEGRSFTLIERKIIEKIVKIMLKDLQESWSNIHKGNMEFVRSEMDPQFANIITQNEHIIVNRFIVDFEKTSGALTLSIPYSTIEPIREKLRRRFEGEKSDADSTWKKYVEKNIMGLTVNLNCILDTIRITGKEFLDIKVGDIIPLDRRIDDSVIIEVESVPKFKGSPGTSNSRKAIRINEFLRSE
jgi:flagellar motor switch protein FliM